MSEHITLFPTTILKQTKSVSAEEKDLWFDLFLNHSNATVSPVIILVTNNYTWKSVLQIFIMTTNSNATHEYLNMLSVSQSCNLDIYLTKSWFNVTNRAGINRHNHAEHHISFVYYPHVPQDNDAGLILEHSGKHRMNPTKVFYKPTPLTKINSMQ